MKKVTISIPAKLLEIAKKKAESEGYSSLGEYVRHLLREDVKKGARMPASRKILEEMEILGEVD